MFSQTHWEIPGSDSRSLSVAIAPLSAGVGSIEVPIRDTRSNELYTLGGSGLCGSIGRGASTPVVVDLSPSTFGIDLGGGAIGRVYKSWHMRDELRLDDLLGSWALVQGVGVSFGVSAGVNVIVFHRPGVVLLEMMSGIFSVGTLALCCRAVAFFHGAGLTTSVGAGVSGGRYAIRYLR
jgi:hypothetical protein